MRGNFYSPSLRYLINYEYKFMKFISKNMNLRVVLKNGIPAEPMSGRNAVPGLYVKFENGVADVKDEDLIQRMINHPGFNSDFIKVEENELDPYADYRSDKEPDHIITEMQFGHAGKTVGVKAKLTAEQKKALRPMAEQLAKEMIKEMGPQIIKDFLAAASKVKKEEIVEDGDEPKKTTSKDKK